MAIKVNGKLVAGGKGADGKSAYQYAVDGGYTGTEDEFKQLIGTGPWLSLNGGTMKGPINMSNKTIYSADGIGLSTHTYPSGMNQMFMDVRFLAISNTSVGLHAAMQQIISDGNFANLCVDNPKQPYHSATKKYVDDSIASAIDDSWSAAY